MSEPAKDVEMSDAAAEKPKAKDAEPAVSLPSRIGLPPV